MTGLARFTAYDQAHCCHYRTRLWLVKSDTGMTGELAAPRVLLRLLKTNSSQTELIDAPQIHPTPLVFPVNVVAQPTYQAEKSELL